MSFDPELVRPSLEALGFTTEETEVTVGGLERIVLNHDNPREAQHTIAEGLTAIVQNLGRMSTAESADVDTSSTSNHDSHGEQEGRDDASRLRKRRFKFFGKFLDDKEMDKVAAFTDVQVQVLVAGAIQAYGNLPPGRTKSKRIQPAVMRTVEDILVKGLYYREIVVLENIRPSAVSKRLEIMTRRLSNELPTTERRKLLEQAQNTSSSVAEDT